MPAPTPSELAALARAIACIGNQKQFAAALTLRCGRKVSSQAVSQWRINGIPEDRCEPIEAITGERVEGLRTDVQWQRDPTGQVIRVFPAPRTITPTNTKRSKRRA